jgi:predicted amidohydrolase YtcJ
VEEASKQYPDLLERRWAVDHCQIVHADQIERAAKLHIMFSCSPTYLYGGDKGGVGAYKILYGEKEAGDSVIPFRGMIDHGVRAVVELDQHAFHPMLALQVMVSRKDINGKVWGAEQRVSREEALYAYTRLSAEYVLREKTMGSIEPKKLADVVVLNRDYLTVPEDEIGRLDPVLTVMDGKITYSQPEFASSQGLPVTGYQGDRSRWKRGTPADARIGYGPPM